jgi:S1-C subfamily serine protease
MALNGGPITDFQEVIALVAQSRIGDTLQIEFLRDGQRMTTNAVLGPRSQVFNAPLQ